ncbi:MAG: hypothetical protein J6V36_05480, partial [Clostridia bacterium]|nr:hypothetical protein [Clostridia bacterium]
MKIIKSIEARMQNWAANNFEKTKYGRKLAKLKDSHKGERCFIIGNGPSLSVNDLNKIYEKNIPTFSTNRIFKLFEKTDWRPTYYVSEDI